MTNPVANENLQKILFNLDDEDWHGHSTETLWVESTLLDGKIAAYIIRNSPFFTKGINYLDVVAAQFIAEENILEFEQTLRKSGWSTYMLLSEFNSIDFSEWWEKLSELGCTYESGFIELADGKKKLYSVSVPPTSDLDAVYDILQSGEDRNVWIFQEGDVGRLISS